MLFANFSNFIPLTALPKNKVAPTGGVNNPIPKFNIKTTPNWIGSIPNDLTIGNIIGVAIKIIGDMSINVPSINNKMLTIIKIMYGLVLIL